MNTQVIEFLTTNPNSNKAQITEATGIKGLPLFNLLKQMIKDGQIASTGDGTETTYSASEPQSGDVVTDVLPIVEQTPTIEPGNEEASAGEQTAGEEQPASPEENKEGVETKGSEQQEVKTTPAATASSRDNSKYKFNGADYGKGPLVRAVISKIVEERELTFKQLKELFPDTLMKRFGVFATESDAKKLSGNKPRYFLKPEQLIKIKGQKEPIAVCNQWTATLISGFIKIATSKEVGYKIK